MAAAGIQCKIPSPPAFLDPLTEINNCYFYAVPKYNEIDHPNTRWMLAMMRNDSADKIKRKMELQPNMFRTSYFQLLDYPQLYSSKDPTATPLFHRQAVLYLTSVGMAIYLRSATILQLLLEYKDPAGEQLYSITDAQYATHVQDTVKGDFHSYPLAAIMLRSGFYDCVTDMLVAQWNPHLPICMPVRRRYERRAFHFLDWLDYVLFLLHDRPLLPLARLVFRLTNDQALYKYKRLPMDVVLPNTEEDRIPTGLIEVDRVPYDSPMIGIKSLLELTEDYGHYLELKDRREAFKNCVKQMLADGVNPEVMMAHAQDYDPGYDEEAQNSSNQAGGANNANNNAARSSSKSSRKGKKGALEDGPFVSEPTRILLYAMHNDTKPSTKVAMLLLLDAVAVYVKRNHYLICPPGKSKSEKQWEKKAKEQLMNLQKRDARNTIVVLLNLLQQQFDKTDRLNKAQRGDKKRPARFKHVDPAKQASNKRRVLTLNIKRLNNLLFMVLLHSGELLDFLESSYPPYQYGENVNFRLNPGLEHRLRSIQLDVMAEFNACKIANSYLSLESLERAQEIKELFLNLRVGRPPALDANAPELHNKNRGGRRNNKAKNASNVNASLADELQLQLLQQQQQQQHQVSFVRVKRRLKAKKVETANEAETDAEAETPKEDDKDGAAASPVETTGVAASLSEQIDRLRRGAQGSADAALAEIYSRIMDDLKMVAATSEGQGVASGREQQQGKPDGEKHNSNGAASEKLAVGQGEEVEDDEEEEESDSSNNRRQVVVRRNGGGGGSKRWRCRARGGGGGGGGGSRRSGHWFQKARVYDAPPGGSEFNMDSTTGGAS